MSNVFNKSLKIISCRNSKIFSYHADTTLWYPALTYQYSNLFMKFIMCCIYDFIFHNTLSLKWSRMKDLNLRRLVPNQVCCRATLIRVVWWRMRESNSHEGLAKAPGSHYINPPLTWYYFWYIWNCSRSTIQLFKKFFSLLRCIRKDSFLFFTTWCSYSCFI